MNSSESFRRDAEDAFEGAGEMEWIAESDLLGDLFNQRPRRLEPLRRKVHFQAQKKAVGTLVIVTPE